jgi:hypothetical protein
MDPHDICPDLEFAIARGIDLLQSEKLTPTAIP